MTNLLTCVLMKRLALFLRYRQRPFMSFDPSQGDFTSSIRQRATSGLKRSFSQRTAALPDNTPSSKAPRIDRSPKCNSGASVQASSQQRQPNNGSSSFRGQRSRSRTGHKLQPGSSASSKSQKKQPQRRLARLEGPFYNREYITQQYNKSLIPLKPLHRETPKSSIGNFSMTAADQSPKYNFKEGCIYLDSGPMNVWRYALVVWCISVLGLTRLSEPLSIFPLNHL